VAVEAPKAKKASAPIAPYAQSRTSSPFILIICFVSNAFDLIIDDSLYA
jgi:hypothetical protein